VGPQRILSLRVGFCTLFQGTDNCTLFVDEKVVYAGLSIDFRF
jgi:hypothetical protein